MSKRASEILDYIAEGKVNKGGALHYELLWEVHDCGANAGSAASALDALDDLCTTFEVEPFPQYVDLLKRHRKKSRKTDEAAQHLISGRARRLFLDALTTRNLDGADDLLSLVKNREQAKWWLYRARDARHDFDTLERDPDDAKVNLAVASYFLAERGDWHAARPYLRRLKVEALRRALGTKSATLAPLELSRELGEAASQIRERDRKTRDWGG